MDASDRSGASLSGRDRDIEPRSTTSRFQARASRDGSERRASHSAVLDSKLEPRQRPSLILRDPGSLSSEEQILLAALRCFLEKGYHGTTIRSVAARAGVSVPGLYHHFRSKSVLLERLIHQVMDDLIAETEEALEAAGDDPLDRFDAVVVAHVRFHCHRPEESFIGNSELRSLSRSARRRVVGKRDQQQRIFDRVVEEGLEAGLFDLEWSRETSRALVTMCTAVATWYRREGEWSSERIVDLYRSIARNLVNCNGRRAKRRRQRDNSKPAEATGKAS
jgi:AcrR family transcriptional regulator